MWPLTKYIERKESVNLHYHGQMQYSDFSVIPGSLIKHQCILFKNFLAVLLPTTLHNVKTWKKFWIHASNIICGVRGGVRPVLIGKRPRNAIKVSQDFCP